MMDWLRWYRGSCTDPKFTVIARKSGQPRVAVLAVWALMLETALQSTPRGHLDSWDHDDAGAALDMDGDAVASIYEAMEERGLVNDGLLVAWAERQYDKSSSTPRVALHRAKEKQKKQAEADETACNAVKQDETLCNAPETETETEADTDTEQKGREGAVAPKRSKVPDMLTWELDEKGRAIILASGLDPETVMRRVRNWASNAKPAKRKKPNPHAFLQNWCDGEKPSKPPPAGLPAEREYLGSTSIPLAQARMHAQMLAEGKRLPPSVSEAEVRELVAHGLVGAELAKERGFAA